VTPPAPARTVLRRALLVALGGAIGTAARLALGLAIPDAGGVPLSVLVANVLGALLIGLLAARLPSSSDTRVFVGTGMLGGFTTYSALAVGTVEVWHQAPLLAAGYAVVSVVLGIAAAALGLRLGRRSTT